MPSKKELREVIRNNLDSVVGRVNSVLKGERLEIVAPALLRLARSGQLPNWFCVLRDSKALPLFDPKTIGSVVEMILVAVLETETFASLGLPPLRINPARGVDLPDVDLGVKSPSENYSTSEPYFSAYDRLLGSEYDALVLLTDYQIAKRNPPLKLQIIKWRYLGKSQIADEALCRLAKKQRDWLLNNSETWAKKVYRFLAFVNQSNWRAKVLLQLLSNIQDDDKIRTIIRKAEKDFASKNLAKLKQDKPLLPDLEVEVLKNILSISPMHLGVIDAADNWVVEVQKEQGRLPNDNEWTRLLTSPLDGAIGMSFALQWRYNFARLFGVQVQSDAE